MSIVRFVVFSAILLAVGGVVGLLTDTPKGIPFVFEKGSSPWLVVPLEGTWTLVDLAMREPRAVLVVALIVGVPWAVSTVAALIPRRVAKDPVRLYKGPVRDAGFARAAHRCEMETVFYRRCRRTATHGDHWFPWSKGGATSLDNFVSACGRCNTLKGAHVPTWGQTWRLEMRRRRYFPPGETTRPGQRLASVR